MTELHKAHVRLQELYYSLKRSGDPDRDFFYLGAPMHDKPQFNYPAMTAAAALLRGNSYNIISPHEIPDDDVVERALESQDGDYATMQRGWADFMADTLTVLAMPTCVGAVFLPEWRESRGCRIEVALMQGLGKQVFQLGEEPELDGCPALIYVASDPKRSDLIAEPPGWVSNAGAVEIAADEMGRKSRDYDVAHPMTGTAF